MNPTLLGFLAIILWSSLAALTVATSPVPPFQLNAICFGIGGLLGLVWIAAGGQPIRPLFRQPVSVWLIGIGSLFLYHAFYFAALRLAPPEQASLIAYLWPLLIVVFSGLLPGNTLQRRHLLGALVAFLGAALVIAGDRGFSASAWAGYTAALACAFIWSGYSVSMRRFASTPSQIVALFCLVVSALSLVVHLLVEQTVWPDSPAGWIAILALGAGPVGAAFFLWDFGMKRGNVQFLGVAAYAAPVISTVILVLTGSASPGLRLAAAALLVTAGAVIASRDRKSLD
jgi:drug/metabolite transporter (DMT)-like permease